MPSSRQSVMPAIRRAAAQKAANARRRELSLMGKKKKRRAAEAQAKKTILAMATEIADLKVRLGRIESRNSVPSSS
jgi:hypothetical protein